MLVLSGLFWVTQVKCAHVLSSVLRVFSEAMKSFVDRSNFRSNQAQTLQIW